MRLFLFLALSLMLLACNPPQRSSGELAQNVKALGVYAETEAGVILINSYGSMTGYLLSTWTTAWGFTFSGEIPRVRVLKYFVVNIPNSNIMESKIYLLHDAHEARWFLIPDPNDPRNPKPLASTKIEPVVNGIYKLASPDIDGKSEGFVCLWVKATGTADRFYCIQLVQ